MQSITYTYKFTILLQAHKSMDENLLFISENQIQWNLDYPDNDGEGVTRINDNHG